METFYNISADAKVVYLLSLSDLIIDNISDSEGYELAIEALKKCWEWVRFKNVKADDLYHYLENMDETDVMTYMQMEDNADNERVWICLANALAYTIWEAYNYEKQKYVPQTIESVDDETIESFISNFRQVYENNNIANKLLDYLGINYPDGVDKELDTKMVKEFVNNIV